VLGHDETLALHERDTWEASGRFTTRRVRAEEREALREARALAEARHHKAVPESVRHRAWRGSLFTRISGRRFEHATAEGGLKIIEGRAGHRQEFYACRHSRRASRAGAPGHRPRADQTASPRI